MLSSTVVESSDPTSWQTLLAASSPLWNLLSALVGGLIAAFAAWRVERNRAQNDVAREHNALKRPAYLEFVETVLMLERATVRTRFVTEAEDDQAVKRSAREDEAGSANSLLVANARLSFYAPAAVSVEADRVATLLREIRDLDLLDPQRDVAAANLDAAIAKLIQAMQSDLGITPMSPYGAPAQSPSPPEPSPDARSK